ncbi:MAG TPA: hypothetical protein VEL51_15255 [Vicinamibacterales bacterium]|nr:hypothetical protein [Vicinamibacterales bacterium]
MADANRMTTTPTTSRKVVYWHQDLPPLSADVCGADVVEARSHRVTGSLSRRDDAWERCHADLMDRARVTLEQEVARRGGDYARVKDERIDTRRDEAKDETWLYGRFRYVLYRELTPTAP